MKVFGLNLEKTGFRARMRIGMVLVIILVTTVNMSTSIYLQGREQIKSLDSLGENIAMNLGQNSKLGILSEEPSNLEQFLNAAFGELQVLGITVYLANGTPISSQKRQEYTLSNLEIDEQLVLLNSSADLIVTAKTETSSGRRLRSYFAKVIIETSTDDIFALDTGKEEFCGFVRVDMSLGELAAEKADILFHNLLLMPITILLGMLLSVVVEKRITKPLLELNTVAKSVAGGDFTKRIAVKDKDELGMLAESFNEMSDELSKTINNLNDANEHMGKVNEELQEFTYIVSHDLQEPLRKVYSFGQFLVEDFREQLPDEGKDYIEKMQKATVKMKQLIQDLLKLSRVGTTEESFGEVKTNEALNSVLEDLFVAIEESRAEITAEELPNVIANPTQLAQIFENLIGNAIKYRSDERDLSIEIGAKAEGDEVVFSIKDNGIGIEERFFDKIFGVFQRLQRDTAKYKGTGIGLSLCKKIVQHHGGKIWVESAFGVGTTFYFTMKKVSSKIMEPENGRAKAERENSCTAG